MFFELLPLILLPWFSLFLTRPKPYLTFTSHHVHTGSCLVESRSQCWRLLETAQYKPVRGKSCRPSRPHYSPNPTIINICLIHIPSQKNLELVPLFLLLSLNQCSWSACTFPLLPHNLPSRLTLHSPLAILSPLLLLLLISEAFSFNWLCFSTSFFLLFWPVCLASFLLH